MTDNTGNYVRAAEAARLCGFGDAREFLNAIAADPNAPQRLPGEAMEGPTYATSDVLRWNAQRRKGTTK